MTMTDLLQLTPDGTAPQDDFVAVLGAEAPGDRIVVRVVPRTGATTVQVHEAGELVEAATFDAPIRRSAAVAAIAARARLRRVGPGSPPGGRDITLAVTWSVDRTVGSGRNDVAGSAFLFHGLDADTTAFHADRHHPETAFGDLDRPSPVVTTQAVVPQPSGRIGNFLAHIPRLRPRVLTIQA